MRTRMPAVVLTSTLAIALAGWAPVGAQANGTVTFTNSSGSTMVEYVKGNMIRMDNPQAGGGGGGAVIMDGSAGTFTVLMPERKMYMQVTGQQVASMADSAS